MAKHALLSASSAHKWSVCHGSIAAELVALSHPVGLESVTCAQDILDKAFVFKNERTSKYAAEGTAAHALAEICLRTNTHPSHYLGQNLNKYHPENPDWVVDADMAGNVNIYVQSIRAYTKAHTEFIVEASLPIGHITGERDAEGTTDCAVIHADLKELQAHDLKYGMGEVVDPEHNLQLELYALGVYEQFSLLYDIKKVKLVIHQPRVTQAPQEWSCTIEELLLKSEWIKEQAAKVRHVLTIPIAEIRHYKTPDVKACRWCKAKVSHGVSCEALTKSVQAATLLDFEDLDSIPKPINLSEALKALPLIEMWSKAVSTAAYTEAYSGRPPEGFKLVEGRMGDRRFTNDTEVEDIFNEHKISDEDRYTKKLITPTSAEEKFKLANPNLWIELKRLIKQDRGNPVLVPSSHKKPAIRIDNVVDAFGVIEEEEEGLA